MRTTRRGDDVLVEVADECGGIPDAVLPLVFDAGWRGDAARHDRGMGLGLTIAREVARSQGGDAAVVNQSDVPGCLVTLSLPGAR
ncbi:MAG TPA: sensor histidine kinase [Dermatophilaceae bacterium]|nr:sensor histidine kinase [Dermatophilaceae bacterium]